MKDFNNVFDVYKVYKEIMKEKNKLTTSNDIGVIFAFGIDWGLIYSVAYFFSPIDKSNLISISIILSLVLYFYKRLLNYGTGFNLLFDIPKGIKIHKLVKKLRKFKVNSLDSKYNKVKKYQIDNPKFNVIADTEYYIKSFIGDKIRYFIEIHNTLHYLQNLSLNFQYHFPEYITSALKNTGIDLDIKYRVFSELHTKIENFRYNYCSSDITDDEYFEEYFNHYIDMDKLPELMADLHYIDKTIEENLNDIMLILNVRLLYLSEIPLDEVDIEKTFSKYLKKEIPETVNIEDKLEELNTLKNLMKIL